MINEEDSMRYLTEPARQIPVVADKDVVVSGGGPAGVMAAVAATRAGASTLLLEASGHLGGSLAMGLPVLGYFDRDGQQIVRGLGEEFVDRLRARGGADQRFVDCALHNRYVIIEPEIAKIVCLEMIRDAGVELYLHSWVTGHFFEAGRLRAVIVENKSGREAIAGAMFVDTSGDGDLAARCGAPFSVGRKQDSLTQSATLTFCLDRVDTELLRRKLLEDPGRYDLYRMPHRQFRVNRKHILVGLTNLVKEAETEGFPGMPSDRIIYITLLREGAVLINMTKVHVHAHDARGLSQGEAEARLQVPVVWEFLRQYVPGFEDATLTWTSSRLGVRETRHIEGDYTLTQEDLLAGRTFPDTVAVGGYPIDIHSPTGGSVDLTLVPAYGIPYRCMVPKNVDNLLVAGRCISATHEAIGSARVMATCMAMGQGVGVASAFAVQEECSTRQVDVSKVQATLREQGAYLLD
jgi:hypothetical protein